MIIFGRAEKFLGNWESFSLGFAMEIPTKMGMKILFRFLSVLSAGIFQINKG